MPRPPPPPLCAATAEEIPEASIIQVNELVSALQSGGGGTRVLDVRTDEEFASGHVKGALHETSEALLDDSMREDRTKELIQSLSKEGVDRLVVHCMYSTNRGPAVVHSLTSAAAELGAKLEVCLLYGGFHKFINTVWQEGDGTEVPEMIEGLKAKHWRRTHSHGLVVADAVEGLEELGVSVGAEPAAGVTGGYGS
eukprot:TRINITY_DN113333_c0_g1_i1.p1 TRINITY_DN113333_c0_g1~~TRINITY_DN113333_c0_g1_i1.p1  ORF type:complete len:196 (+),score=46.86 TRINITY_DN113333_c0_g1_i1:68-655(+)